MRTPVTQLSVAVLSLIFGLAGISKIFRFWEFAASLAEYDIIPDFLLTGCALAVVALEILVAVALIPAQTRCVAAFCGLGLSLAFLGFVTHSYLSGTSGDCGCFSLIKARIGLQHLLFDASLAGLFAVVGFGARAKRGGRSR